MCTQDPTVVRLRLRTRTGHRDIAILVNVHVLPSGMNADILNSKLAGPSESGTHRIYKEVRREQG